MTDFDVDRSGILTLRSRSAGQAGMQKVLQLQDHAPQRGRVARALGHSPLHPDAVSWYDGALAELETGRRLAALGSGYTVLHSLPLGDTDGTLQTAVDHLVIGPSGVFCLNSTQTVTAAQLEAVAVDARRVSKHLSRTLQRVVPVTPLLVSVRATNGKSGGAAASAAATGLRRVAGTAGMAGVAGTSAVAAVAGVAGAAGPAGVDAAAAAADVDGLGANVEVVASRSLAGWFAKRGPVLTTAELATLAFAAEHPSTWRSPASSVDRAMPMDNFYELQSEVDAASDRERTALIVAVVVAVIVAIVSASVIVKSLFPGVFAH